jgi:hypothetical protein
MSEPTITDLARLIETLTTRVASLQMSVTELQKEKSTSSSGGPGGHDGQHHHDRPPRFQKMNFPRYDGKTDPLIFTNHCELYFHQQRIMEEEKVWMASHNLEEGRADVVHPGPDGRGHPVLGHNAGSLKLDVEPALWATAACCPAGRIG